MVGVMSTKNMPDSNADMEKNEEIHQIENWLEELPEFDEHGHTPLSYEALLSFVENAKKDNDSADDRIIIGKVTDVLSHETDLERIDPLFALLKDHNADSSDYSMIGMSSYEVKNFGVSERAYRMAIEQCTEDYLMTGYKNNLAYLIRRKDLANPEKKKKKEAPILLRDGVANKDTFSLINMALFWALEYGGEENWDLADKLVSYVDKNDVTGALEWWKGVALADEAEGYLVHLLLVRHGKVGSSPLGKIEELFDRVKKDYPGIPEKMKSIVASSGGGICDDFPAFPPGDWN